MAENVETNTTEDTAGETPENTVNLSVADLEAAVQIIDFAAGRGAFTGDNITKVGQVRDRLAEIVRVLAPTQVAETDAETE